MVDQLFGSASQPHSPALTETPSTPTATHPTSDEAMGRYQKSEHTKRPVEVQWESVSNADAPEPAAAELQVL